MKRVLALLLALIMIAVTFASCDTESNTCSHIDDVADHICDICGDGVGVHADKSNDGNHKCDHCYAVMSLCEDTDKDHKCDECGESTSEHFDNANDGNHLCEYCDQTVSGCGDSNNDKICDECGKKTNSVTNSTDNSDDNSDNTQDAPVETNPTNPNNNVQSSGAYEINLKELRANLEFYEGEKVAFEGVIFAIDNGSFYVEEYDEETKMYYGISVYYATSGLPGRAMEFIEVGNRVRVVGALSYFEPGDLWQVSGLTYNIMRPEYLSNFKLISTGHTTEYMLISPSDLETKKISVTIKSQINDKIIETSKEVDYVEMATDTSVSMKNLTVTDTYISYTGKITLYCTSNDTEISLYLGEMCDANNNPVTSDMFKDKTVDVKGIFSRYIDEYQIHVLNINDIIIY